MDEPRVDDEGWTILGTPRPTDDATVSHYQVRKRAADGLVGVYKGQPSKPLRIVVRSSTDITIEELD